MITDHKCPKCGEELNVWVMGTLIASTEITVECESCGFKQKYVKCWVPKEEVSDYERVIYVGD